MRRSFLIITCSILMAVTSGVSLSFAKKYSKFDYKFISNGPATRSVGDSQAMMGKREKPLIFINKCKFNAHMYAVYQNKSGIHRVATTLAPGQTSSSDESIHKVFRIINGDCQKKPGNAECFASLAVKARKIKITCYR